MPINHSAGWQQLLKHYQQIAPLNISSMFMLDKERAKLLSVTNDYLYMDYSKQHVTLDTIDKLVDLANFSGLSNKINSLFNGEIINLTENRAALHTSLRDPNANHLIKQQLTKMGKLVEKLNNSHFTDVISVGIGGSDLGPAMVCNALQDYKISKLNIHFISNADNHTLEKLIAKLSPATTICVINSKTFTTIETLTNAQLLKNWIVTSLGEEAVNKQFIGVTANVDKALAFGINEDHVLQFWDWVGGRYSVWSTVGLPIALLIGMDGFYRFLQGAHKMDCHFKQAPFNSNMPVLMALIGIWNINFFNYHALAIMPYLDQLELLVSYLQQLEMESNGKSITNEGLVAEYHTAPIIWGGVGCNGQHAYMQLLHQGTQIVPVDFILSAKSNKLLIASCLGQSKALMLGRKAQENSLQQLAAQCPGNRPNTTIIFEQLTPEVLGSLIALYEHKVFVQGVIWQIQSFDQYGVELGKQLIQEILPKLDNINLSQVEIVNFLRSNLISTEP